MNKYFHICRVAYYSLPDHIITQTAKYECDKCGHKWKLRHSTGQPKPCNAPGLGCDKTDIQPYDFDPDPWREVYTYT